MKPRQGMAQAGSQQVGQRSHPDARDQMRAAQASSAEVLPKQRFHRAAVAQAQPPGREAEQETIAVHRELSPMRFIRARAVRTMSAMTSVSADSAWRPARVRR